MIKTVIGENKYGVYCVPSSSAKTSPPAKNILTNKVYEPQTIEYIRDNCGDGDIIHAGTYFGDFIPAIAHKCKGTVWAFEPKAEHFWCTSQTVMMNNVHNVELFNAGLGNSTQTLNLQVIAPDDGRTWGGGSRITDETDGDLVEHITINRVDDIIPIDRNVSIIHLDIEGFEQFALEGAMGTIKKHLPKLIIETLPPTEWMQTNLYSIGYKIKTKLHHNTLLTV